MLKKINLRKNLFTSFLLQKERISLFSWIIIPIFIIWISTNYLIGNLKQPKWDGYLTESNIPNNKRQASFTASSYQKLHWKNEGLVTFWFDDAWINQYTIAFPILENNNIKAALSVPTKAIGAEAYMSWTQIRKLQFQGWEIDSHSRSHSCNIDKLTAKDIQEEVVKAKEDFTTEGISVENYVTPCGYSSPEVIEAIKRNYLAMRTTDDGSNPLPANNIYSLKANVIENNTSLDDIKEWLKEASDNKAWTILVFHQIEEGNNRFSNSVKRLNEVIKLVQESGLKIVLPSQALQLIIEE